MIIQSKTDEVFGHIARQHNLLSEAQVDEALALVESGERGVRTLADAIRKLGLLSPGAVRAIRRAVNYHDKRLQSKLYARIALKNDLVTLEQIQDCLELQKRAYVQRESIPELGELLREQATLTPVQDAAIRSAMEDLEARAFVARKSSAPDEDAFDSTASDDSVVEESISDASEATAEASDIDESDDLLADDSDDESFDPTLAETSDVAIVQDADPQRTTETGDELEPPLLQPRDLQFDDGPNAAGSSDGTLPEVFAKAARKRDEDQRQPYANLEPINGLDALDNLELEPPAVRDSETTIQTCPECRVDINVGVTECLYCGYHFVDGPTSNEITDEVLLLADEHRAKLSLESADEAHLDDPTTGPQQPECEATGAPASTTAISTTPLADAYEAIEELASSARGDLLRATSRATGTQHLIWRLPQTLAPTDEQISALVDCAIALNELELRHVAAFHQFATDSAGSYAVYANAPGSPATVVCANDGLDRLRANALIKHIACVLVEAEREDLWPRELRPEGILLPEEADGIPVIVGFGLTRLFEPPATGAPDANEDAYVPPERKRKPDRADVRTGLFGLGALWILMLTGEAPVLNALPDLPGAMKSFMNKTLDNAPGKRYLSAAKVFMDLDRCPGAKGLDITLR